MASRLIQMASRCPARCSAIVALPAAACPVSRTKNDDPTSTGRTTRTRRGAFRSVESRYLLGGVGRWMTGTRTDRVNSPWNGSVGWNGPVVVLDPDAPQRWTAPGRCRRDTVVDRPKTTVQRARGMGSSRTGRLSLALALIQGAPDPALFLAGEFGDQRHPVAVGHDADDDEKGKNDECHDHSAHGLDWDPHGSCVICIGIPT